MKLKQYDVKPTMLLGELVGTFVLATVAVTVANPLIVGFTLVVLVLALGAISGSNLNPAVTFGLWSVKRMNTVKMLMYWAMQFMGAFLALMIAQMFQGGSYGVSFASFGEFDTKLVVAELLAVAVFTFAVAAAIHRELGESAKSFAIGLGLLVGLAVGGGLIGQAAQNITVATQKDSRISVVDGVVANPAIALAATEKAQQNPQSQFGLAQGEQPKPEQPASRLGLETIVGGLVGGAIGMNLYMVLAGVNPFEKSKSAKAKATVTKVFKKGKKKTKK
jgi:hypothetical protein